MLRFLTAGESHGPELTVIVDGLPAGLRVSREALDAHLSARQAGFGRGGRMRIEQDRAEVTAGLRAGLTTGAPVSVRLRNQDHVHWRDFASAFGAQERTGRVTRPRPGHADLAGALKYGLADFRDVLERASARETASRAAAGGLALQLLRRLGVDGFGWTDAIGSVATRSVPASVRAIARRASSSSVRCPDSRAGARMVREIRRAQRARESLGGVAAVRFEGVPAGLGSYAQADRRLDARLAGVVLSIPSVKGVWFGDALETSRGVGSRAQDAIVRRRRAGPSGRLARATNRAGGVEAGVSNGEAIVLRAAMKPLSTLPDGLRTVDLASGRVARGVSLRTDTCVVPAGSVVLLSVAAIVLADAMLEKFGGDSLGECDRARRAYLADLARRTRGGRAWG